MDLETDMPQKLQKGKTALYVYSPIRDEPHPWRSPVAAKTFFPSDTYLNRQG